MAFYQINGKRPVVDESAWVAPSADLIGDVVIGKNCYVGWGVVIRGDYGTVIIEDGSAIEENVTIHARPGDFTRIGRNVTVGHNAMIHNAVIKDFAVIGMSSTITDFTVIGEWAIVGEHSLVKRNQTVPAGKIYAGVPAVEKGDVQEKHRVEWTWAKELYQGLAAKYRTDMVKLPE